MSKKINRRQFIARSVASLAGMTVAGSVAGSALASIRPHLSPEALAESLAAMRGGAAKPLMVGRVTLGRTGIEASRMALGTGTIGVGGSSNQTKLGQEAFSAMFRHGYERGVRFCDMAENYGSMPFVGAAIKGLPRADMTLLSKMWTEPDDSKKRVDVRGKIEEYLRLVGVDYLDVLLMHCMTSGDWDTTRTRYIEVFSRAKEEGLVRAVGVSCHDLGALRTAAASPWVDVIMARINPFGTIMDGTPEVVSGVLKQAIDNGKGVVGMKIFGEGRHVSEPEREQSINYAIHSVGVHALTMGMESIPQLDDAADRVIRLASGK